MFSTHKKGVLSKIFKCLSFLYVSEMGRIRTQHVKRMSRKFLDLYPGEFNSNFEQNKKKMDELADIPSKKLRNRVAGYVTKLVKAREKEKGGS